MVFKQNAYRAISNSDADESREIVSVDYHYCLFGQWYFGEQGERFKNTTGFAQIDLPHQQVHQSIMQALTRREENWQGDENIRNEIVTNVKEMELSSQTLRNKIDMMVDEKNIH